MKKTVLFTAAILLASLLHAGNEKYYKNMAQNLQAFASCESVEDYMALANKFHVISAAEKGEWLPRYYEVQCYLILSFRQGESTENKERYLEQAEPILEEVMQMAPNNPEALTLQAWWYTSKLVIDPPARSMSLQPLIAQSLATALAIEPGHPRALFLRISNDMGTAAFFGNDTAPYCEEARELLANWDNYKPASPIHPSWGKEDVEGIVRRCGQ